MMPSRHQSCGKRDVPGRYSTPPALHGQLYTRGTVTLGWITFDVVSREIYSDRQHQTRSNARLHVLLPFTGILLGVLNVRRFQDESERAKRALPTLKSTRQIQNDTKLNVRKCLEKTAFFFSERIVRKVQLLRDFSVLGSLPLWCKG